MTSTGTGAVLTVATVGAYLCPTEGDGMLLKCGDRMLTVPLQRGKLILDSTWARSSRRSTLSRSTNLMAEFRVNNGNSVVPQSLGGAGINLDTLTAPAIIVNKMLSGTQALVACSVPRTPGTWLFQPSLSSIGARAPSTGVWGVFTQEASYCNFRRFPLLIVGNVYSFTNSSSSYNIFTCYTTTNLVHIGGNNVLGSCTFFPSTAASVTIPASTNPTYASFVLPVWPLIIFAGNTQFSYNYSGAQPDPLAAIANIKPTPIITFTVVANFVGFSLN